MPERCRGSHFGALPADSCFCSRRADYAAHYTAAEFAAAFIETLAQDRLAWRQVREVALREITERDWIQEEIAP